MVSRLDMPLLVGILLCLEDYAVDSTFGIRSAPCPMLAEYV